MTMNNTQLLEKIYRDFASGDLVSMMAACADGCTFQLSGKSKLAGKYDKTTFPKQFCSQLKELSGGTFQLETHEVMASDRHGIVLGTVRMVRDGKKIEYRTVHVWRIENGKPVAWYEYPRDLYQYDAIWN